MPSQGAACWCQLKSQGSRLVRRALGCDLHKLKRVVGGSGGALALRKNLPCTNNSSFLHRKHEGSWCRSISSINIRRLADLMLLAQICFICYIPSSVIHRRVPSAVGIPKAVGIHNSLKDAWQWLVQLESKRNKQSCCGRNYLC